MLGLWGLVLKGCECSQAACRSGPELHVKEVLKCTCLSSNITWTHRSKETKSVTIIVDGHLVLNAVEQGLPNNGPRGKMSLWSSVNPDPMGWCVMDYINLYKLNNPFKTLRQFVPALRQLLTSRVYIILRVISLMLRLIIIQLTRLSLTNKQQHTVFNQKGLALPMRLPEPPEHFVLAFALFLL